MTPAPHQEVGVFAELRRNARAAYEAGRLEEALDFYERASEWAREQGDGVAVERAFCGRASVSIELGRGETFVPELRRILMGNADDENCFLAAYNLARDYELRKANKKGLFYARVARDRAVVVGSAEWLASAHNLIGNLLLADSFFADAARQFETALRLLPAEDGGLRRALIQDNVGYAYVVQGRHTEGRRLLHESLSTLRRHGAKRYEVHPHLDLCLAYLESGHVSRAAEHGREALRLAEAVLQNEELARESFTPRDARVVQDFKSLSDEAQREVADFIAFKRLQDFRRDDN